MKCHKIMKTKIAQNCVVALNAFFFTTLTLSGITGNTFDNIQICSVFKMCEGAVVIYDIVLLVCCCVPGMRITSSLHYLISKHYELPQPASA